MAIFRLLKRAGAWVTRLTLHVVKLVALTIAGIGALVALLLVLDAALLGDARRAHRP